MRDYLAPVVGAIYWASMPYAEDVCVAGPKQRPVLLLEHARTAYGTLEVLVAYGTSQKTDRFHLGETVVRKNEAPFLNADTKFCLTKRMWLPATEEFFSNAQPLGMFPKACLRALKDACLEAGIDV